MRHSQRLGGEPSRRPLLSLVPALLVACLVLLAPPLPAASAPKPATRPELLLQTGHLQRIHGLGVSPDARRVATSSEDGTVKIWDSATGHLEQTIVTRWSPRSGSQGPSYPVFFTPDGRRIVTETSDSNIAMYDVATGRPVATLPTEALAYALDPRGRILAVGTNRGVELFDLSGRTPTPLPLPADKQGLDEKSRPSTNLLRGTPLEVRSLAFSSDGQTLVFAGRPDSTRTPRQVQAWRVPSWTLKAQVNFSNYAQPFIAVSPDGTRVAGRMGRDVVFWDTATTTPRPVSGLASTPWYDISFHPTGSRVAIAGAAPDSESASVHLIDWTTGKATPGARTRFPITAVTHAPAGNFLVTGDDTGRGVIWSTGAGLQPRVGLAGRIHAMNQVGFFDRGQRMVTCGTDRAVKIWDCVSGRPQANVIRLPWDDLLHHRYAAMALNPDGRTVVTGDWDGTLVAWEIASGRKIWTSSLQARRSYAAIWAVAYSPDGRSIVAGNQSGCIGVYEAKTGRQRFLEQPRETPVVAITFTPDNRTVATGGLDGFVDQWDISHFRIAHIARREVPITYTRHKSVQAIAFSSDSRHMAVATSSGRIFIWETESDEPPTSFGPSRVSPAAGRGTTKGSPPEAEPYSAVTCASFSPDGGLLATGDDLGRIRLWDVRRRTLRSTIASLQGLPVTDLSFTPNGRFLASANHDGTVRLFDTETSTLRATLVEIHDDPSFAAPSGPVGVDLATDSGSSKHWIVTTPDGLFDGSPAAQRCVEWRIGDKTFSVEQFFNEFYTPGLLGRILNPKKSTEALAPQVSLTDLPVPPRVEIVSPTGGDHVKGDTVEVRVRITDQGGGTATPSLYLNGHRLSNGTRQAGPQGTLAWSLRLVPGENRLRATAYNRQGNVESRGDEIRIQCDAPTSTARPTLHVIAVGVDHYRAGMSLAFARADAQAIARFFKPGLFGDVKTHVLLDEKATRQEILATLDEVAKASSPQDAVLLYLAGHGTLVGQVFYFLPHDARVNSDEEVRASALSSVELGDALTRITATKQLLVLDACHSGASTPSMSRMLANRDSIAEIRAVQRLSRSSGSFLIAASKAEQYAKEIPELGHGVLTYAILTALGEKGRAAAAPNAEGQITVNSLLRYLGDEVPVLTDRYQRGDRQEIVQASTGQDFPLVVTSKP